MSARSRAGILPLAGAVLVSACAGAGTGGPANSDDEMGDGLRVVATTSILGDLASTLVDDAGSVTTLMAPGVDPHGFEASPRQAQQLREADLVVANGLQLEERLLDALDAARQAGVEVLEVGEQLDPMGFGEVGGEHGHDTGQADDADGQGHDVGEAGHDEEQDEEAPAAGDDHDHGPSDPHVWLDPVRMARAAELIAGELAAVDRARDDAAWAQRGEALARELEDLDAELAGILDAVSHGRRVLVTNHESLGYFAERYDFELLGAVVPGGSTQAQTNPRQFAELAEIVEREDVPAIFAENVDSTRLAEALREEVGGDLEIVELYTDALGEPGSGAETYPELMRANAELIAGALAG